MEQIEKGCVYFFRHIGLTPIKIGYSNSESPIDRFQQFSTYAPYGSEIIGFIQTEKAKELETTLHNKFASKRINREWFEITEQEAVYEIDFYSKVEEVNERNEFQKIYAQYIKDKKMKIKSDVINFNSLNAKEKFLKTFKVDEKINIKRYADQLGVSRRTLYNWINDLKNN